MKEFWKGFFVGVLILILLGGIGYFLYTFLSVKPIEIKFDYDETVFEIEAVDGTYDVESKTLTLDFMPEAGYKVKIKVLDPTILSYKQAFIYVDEEVVNTIFSLVQENVYTIQVVGDVKIELVDPGMGPGCVVPLEEV